MRNTIYLTFVESFENCSPRYVLEVSRYYDSLWTQNYGSDMTNLWDVQPMPVCSELWELAPSG